MESVVEVANPMGSTSIVVPRLVRKQEQEQEKEPQEVELQEVRCWSLVHPTVLASVTTPAIGAIKRSGAWLIHASS
ncbi:hypothetical protein GUJ93_ZPchr0013g36301 [Zizania palustris]|uniref:Uncharacterized protein n=1 Tax=Zizania palustris TaxID=103762 RepID=A0A8J6BZG9_ZIZPA|nr:hypothetical protein GUJ93_ZPchr0013g36301 [Zizania palustris]